MKHIYQLSIASMKRPYNKHRKDISLMLISASIPLLYHTGMPSDLIVELVMVGLLIAAMAYVFIYLLVGIFKDVRSSREFKKIAKLKQSTDQIDTMSWQEFEIFVAKWLKHEGYDNVRITEYYDLGVDIIAKKDGITWGVQVKHYRNFVGINAVRQVVPALNLYKCEKAMVVTNSYFSRPAKELAASLNCVLVEREQLRKSPATL
jgi:restriction system protein